VKLFPLLKPAGSDTEVQYNNGNLFGGDSALTWDDGAAKALTIGNCAVLGADSAVFQPNVDSTTFFQILDADGGTAVLNVDSTNESVQIGSATHVAGTKALVAGDMRIGDTAAANSIVDIRSTTTGRWRFNGANFMSATSVLLAFDRNNQLWRNNGGGTEWMRLTAGFLGLGESAPETLLELTHATPYITLHNSTHEDTDGGRESRLNFKGEQSGGEETTLVRIEARHDGAADDQKGEIVISTNDGSDSDTPTDAVFIDSSQQVGIGNAATIPLDVKAKSGHTAIGGFAIKLTNKTGAVTVQGQTVKADTATDDGVILTAADDDECFGVFLEAGVADDAEAWVVVGGIADVAMGDNEAATHGNWVETNSAEAGYADATAGTPAAAPQHFNEIGHCIESVAAGGGGTHILARCVLHFN
jgi:hypothetical protein